MKFYNGMEIAWETKTQYYLVTSRVGRLCLLTMVDKPKKQMGRYEIEECILKILKANPNNTYTATELQGLLYDDYEVDCTIMQIGALCKSLEAEASIISVIVDNKRFYCYAQ